MCVGVCSGVLVFGFRGLSVKEAFALSSRTGGFHPFAFAPGLLLLMFPPPPVHPGHDFEKKKEKRKNKQEKKRKRKEKMKK